MKIYVIQHINSKKQRQMPEKEWISFAETESGKSWKVVKRLGVEQMEEKKFVPPEIEGLGYVKLTLLNKRAIAEADKEAKSKKK